MKLYPHANNYFTDYSITHRAIPSSYLSGKSKLDENFYVRQDGTCAYYFTTEEIQELSQVAGLECEENEYILRQYANRLITNVMLSRFTFSFFLPRFSLSLVFSHAYIHVYIHPWNRKQAKARFRVWIHAKLVKR